MATDARHPRVETRAGVFAQALLDAFPDLPIADEEDLRESEVLRRFLTQVRARHQACG